MLSAWLHITDQCNLRCPYCYLSRRREDMSLETEQAAIDAIFRSANRHGYQDVKLKYAGGEPLIRAEMVWKIHQYALNQAPAGVAVRGVVLSNGVLLTPEIIEQLKKFELDLMISLDGLGETHDQQRPLAGGGSTSAKTKAAIDLAIAHDFWPVVSVTVTAQNAAGLADLVAWLLASERKSKGDPNKSLKFSLNFYRENDCAGQQSDLQLEEDEIMTRIRNGL